MKPVPNKGANAYVDNDMSGSLWSTESEMVRILRKLCISLHGSLGDGKNRFLGLK